MGRRPLTNTDVISTPKPRRSRIFRPAVPIYWVELDWIKLDLREGRSFSTSPTLVCPLRVRSVAVTVVTGMGESSVGRARREPVTIMACPSPVELSGSWAKAWEANSVVPRMRGATVLRNSDFLERSEEHTSELQSLMRISYAV